MKRSSAIWRKRTNRFPGRSRIATEASARNLKRRLYRLQTRCGMTTADAAMSFTLKTMLYRFATDSFNRHAVRID